MTIVEHVKWRVSVGYGLDWAMLRLLLQELFIAIKQANPTRVTGLKDIGKLSSLSWLHHFAERHNISGRATMPISKGRQSITPEEIQLWQEDAIAFFSSKPELMDALGTIIASGIQMKLLWNLELLRRGCWPKRALKSSTT